MTVGATPRSFATERAAAALVGLTLLGAWELAARSGAVSPFLFPAPSHVGLVFGRLIASGDLPAHTWATLTRVGLGFVLGGIPGVIVGLLMGWAPRFRAFADPLVSVIHPIPKIAVLPLFLMVFGLGETSKVVVVSVSVFFPMLISAMAGVRQIQAVHFEAAKAFGGGTWVVFTQVVLRGSLPLLLTGARLAFNVGLVLTLAVELIVAHEGLGRMIWMSWQTMRTEELYAALVVIAALGVGFNTLIEVVTKYVAPWHESRTS